MFDDVMFIFTCIKCISTQNNNETDCVFRRHPVPTTIPAQFLEYY